MPREKKFKKSNDNSAGKSDISTFEHSTSGTNHWIVRKFSAQMRFFDKNAHVWQVKVTDV